MTGFWKEVRIIPGVAWFIAVVAYAGLTCLLLTVAIPHDPKLEHWPVAGQVLFGAGIPLILLVHILLVGYVNADARRRGMRYVLWTFLAALLSNAIGIILYFVLRDPIPVPCPQCGTLAGKNFAFCPKCGAEVSPACPSCKHTIERGWSNCPYCGARIGGGARSA
ncbi:MAG TPA: zinc ribbon domain-containing protein [Verrucomicrobiae bacterium]|jgi:hypothetical protein|nr:zinc ribbon domain-containing protein [Verrucomicrobiae bacterium]